MQTAQSRSQRAVLLAENNLQSSLLKELLEQKLAMDIRLISIERLNNYQTQHNDHEVSLIIVDQPALSERHLTKYNELRSHFDVEAQEVLINSKPGIRQSELLRWQRLVGIFYGTDDMDKLIKGFKCILNGEMWMSRKLIHEYIKLYRQRLCASTNPYYTHLTKREKQIIKLLGEGATNVQIAEELFLSENTVKAHLHNTFKKINVSNRLQALIWVKDNVSPHEYLT
ncbi:LuxR C-terminal-related transcriptional regulator [Vibrio maritimus]|uniref:LuxR C-terminal-related transcriptional regulator n=1 Tax=Vibrio maritimus TaxID=990268 RepID=UPI001F291C13|nr:LuxR C-terminal-related transcriptional regulator [Vibrio maritimus]